MTGSTLTGAWPEYLGILVASTVLCALLTPVAMRIATRAGVLDEPGGHKSHDSPVPYIGGVAIVLAFASAVVVGTLLDRLESVSDEILWIIGLAMVLAVVGLLDDLRDLTPLVRLLAEVAAAVAVWNLGTGVRITGVDEADLVLTVLWIVGITNAFNLLDNMDGLAA